MDEYSIISKCTSYIIAYINTIYHTDILFPTLQKQYNIYASNLWTYSWRILSSRIFEIDVIYIFIYPSFL